MTQVQVLTIHMRDVDDVADVAGQRFKASMTLGVAEFDGLLKDSWTVLPFGHLLGVCVWRDQASMRAFRHSELYARLMMDVHTDGVRDEAFALADDADAQELNALSRGRQVRRVVAAAAA